MSRPLRWIIESHRGMYVHALAFKLPDDWLDSASPGAKWGYLVGVGRCNTPTADMRYAPELDDADYYTPEAAEQAALHYGRHVIDVMIECG